MNPSLQKQGALTPSLTDAFNKITGGKVSTGSNAGPSRADEVLQIANKAKSDASTPKTFGDVGSDYVSGVEKTYADTPGKLSDDVKAGADDIQKGINEKSVGGLGDVFKGIAKSGLRTSGDSAEAIFAPLSQIFSTATKSIPEDAPIKKGFNDVVNFLANHISNNKAVQDFATSHPNAGEDFGRALNLIMSGQANDEINPSRMASETSTAAKNLPENVKSTINNSIERTKNAASSVKEKLAPTPTIDSLVGQVAQGKTGDIPSFGRGLQNLDTSNVKNYTDLNNSASSKISELAKEQDMELDKNPTPHPLSDFDKTIGSGKGAVKVNYVDQAIKQLQDYYTKTNDVESLSKVNQIAADAQEKGLSAKEINNLARMHGQDLNGYNANDELASGLSKQAAENTRQGLKADSRGLMDSKMAQNLDDQMSDLYTVKDLSGKMKERVNTLEQRLQKPNILQKLGSLAGKFGRSTGIGDFVQKLLGFEKTPGATTLNPVELEAKLSRNLAKINTALQKGDAGFINDITNLINEN